MQKFCALFLSVFALPAFATGISGTSAPCDNDTLSKYNGTANIEIDWEPNVIGLTWYDGDTQVEGPTSCVYDSTITVPPQPTKLGYTFNGWKVMDLPSGYTRLEYIESNGVQQINTGVTSDNGIGIKAEVQIQLTDAPPAERAIVGLKDYCGGYEVFFSSNGKYISAWNANSKYASVKVDYTTGVIYRITSEMTSNRITLNVNGVENTYSGTVNGRSTDETTLFNLCNQFGIYARLYSAKIWKDGTLVRNFIPAKNSSNVIGLYDMVSKAFFTNAGSGSFTAGPAIH